MSLQLKLRSSRMIKEGTGQLLTADLVLGKYTMSGGKFSGIVSPCFSMSPKQYERTGPPPTYQLEFHFGIYLLRSCCQNFERLPSMEISQKGR